jgi:hypothetical protein
MMGKKETPIGSDGRSSEESSPVETLFITVLSFSRAVNPRRKEFDIGVSLGKQ